MDSWTRLLSVSATQTLPSESMAMPFGSENWPSLLPAVPNWLRYVACGGELLHPVVAGVGDPDVAFGVGGEAGWRFELAVARAFGAELADEFAFGVELLDAVVAGVGDPDVAFGVDGDALGRFELAVFGSGSRTGSCTRLRR